MPKATLEVREAANIAFQYRSFLELPLMIKKHISVIYILIVSLGMFLAYFWFSGRYLFSRYLSQLHPEKTSEYIDFTSPETREWLSHKKERDAEEENRRSLYFDYWKGKNYDTRVEGYSIIKTCDLADSTFKVYSLIISRNDSVKFRTTVGVEDSDGVNYILFSLIPNGRKQVIIEEYTGGAHCCCIYWFLDLADSIRVLYHSNEVESEIGRIDQIVDFNHDGRFEFTQLLKSFHYFDRLCGACSPFSAAVYKYSKETGTFVLASREFPRVNLEDIDRRKNDVRQFLDTTKSFNEDLSSTLLELTLDVLTRYVYAGQDSLGWSFFDKYYVLPDKHEMELKIQDVFDRSVVYNELYSNKN